MHRSYKIYHSRSFDPAVNLSMEEYLIKNASSGEMILFLWQNSNTVVIGRNQNPYKECDAKKLIEDDVKLVRRLSGGGAVYQDLGNLNFTFIASDENYSVDDNFSIILTAISMHGINGYFNGKNDLLYEGRKFSGSAFTSEDNISCHHGTLLVDSDLQRLGRYLSPSPLKLSSNAVDSVISRVVNLKEISDEITVEKLKSSIIKSFKEFYRSDAASEFLEETTYDLTAYTERYRVKDWNYDQSPDFTVNMERKFPWGICEVNIMIRDGLILDFRLYTDSIVQQNFSYLCKSLKGRHWDAEQVCDRIKNIIEDPQIKEDLCLLIQENKF